MERNEYLENIMVLLNADEMVESKDRIIFNSEPWKTYIEQYEIDDYLDIKEKVASEPNTAISYPGYFEQLLFFPRSNYFFPTFSEKASPIEVKNGDSSIKCEVSFASSKFLLHNLEKLSQKYRRAFAFETDQSKLKDPEPWSKYFRNIITIKIQVDLKKTREIEINKVKEIAESVLFNISYGLDIAITLAKSWEKPKYRTNTPRYKEFQFPKVLYKSDLVSYYELALSSESQMLKYLSLYKIIEHFFTSSSEKTLFKEITLILKQPNFTYSKPIQLRNLTKQIRKHDQKANEEEQLKMVLKEYFQIDELEEWLIDYEKENSTYYTTPVRIFNETLQLNLTDDKIYASLTKRIYHIRNALVHNKEDQNLGKFIPFSEHEEILNNEIPLIRFLAEQLIIKSGVDI